MICLIPSIMIKSGKCKKQQNLGKLEKRFVSIKEVLSLRLHLCWIIYLFSVIIFGECRTCYQYKEDFNSNRNCLLLIDIFKVVITNVFFPSSLCKNYSTKTVKRVDKPVDQLHNLEPEITIEAQDETKQISPMHYIARTGRVQSLKIQIIIDNN